ncbi:hypothetical protein KSP40_PGU011180 [Platanthera guangdongensis]|uniref:Uncharacterized protein n=1 Tax=Platanthera guangdongensis TaxID=2320717 RepID=A0ABR2MD51_9ASPA
MQHSEGIFSYLSNSRNIMLSQNLKLPFGWKNPLPAFISQLISESESSKQVCFMCNCNFEISTLAEFVVTIDVSSDNVLKPSGIDVA